MNDNSKWSKAKLSRLSLFLFGVLIATFAWFLDNALEIKPVLNFIAPNYIMMKDAIDQLDSSETSKIPIGLEGSQVLLKWWKPKPPSDLLNSVTFIGRSTGIFNIITGRHRYELRLLTGSNGSTYIGPPYVWVDYEAKEKMQKELTSGLFKWKAWAFFIGLLISVISGGWEFFKRDTEQKHPDGRAETL